MSRYKQLIASVPIEDFIIPLLLLILVFSTNNRLILLMKPVAFLMISAVLFLSIASKRRFSRGAPLKYLFFGFVFLIGISFIYTGDRSAFKDYIPYIIATLVFVVFEFDDYFYSIFFQLFSLLFWVFIASMYLELISPSLFGSVFSFLSLGKNLVVRSVDGIAIAGLAFEKADAAFLCNMGLGVVFAKIFTRGLNPKFIIQLGIVFGALMMTGKRTLFLIPLVSIVAFALLFSRSHRVVKAMAVLLTVFAFLAVAYTFIPQVSLVFERLLSDNGDPLSGREVFWTYAMEMFRSSPLVGRGFLSFNAYVNGRGFLYYGEPWRFQAHNVYLQLLAELGIIGLLLFISMLVILLFGLGRSAKKDPNIFTLSAFYWTVLIVIYSLTGNTIYYACQLMVFAVTIGIYLKYLSPWEGYSK